MSQFLQRKHSPRLVFVFCPHRETEPRSVKLLYKEPDAVFTELQRRSVVSYNVMVLMFKLIYIDLYLYFNVIINIDGFYLLTTHLIPTGVHL